MRLSLALALLVCLSLTVMGDDKVKNSMDRAGASFNTNQDEAQADQPNPDDGKDIAPAKFEPEAPVKANEPEKPATAPKPGTSPKDQKLVRIPIDKVMNGIKLWGGIIVSIYWILTIVTIIFMCLCCRTRQSE